MSSTTPLTDRIKAGKPAPTSARTRVVRDSKGRLSELWLVNGVWVTPKG